jgi:microcystin-dependent protein
MAKQLFGNNASSLLAASISDADLTIQVANGFGALFPNPGADEFFLVVLENDQGDYEVVKITSRTSDLLTVPVGGRGQEGTSAQAWTNGQARVELRLTRGTMEVFIQRAGDEMTGDLNMNENEIQDAILTGANTRIEDGEIVGVPLRGATGDTSNEIVVPGDGSRATAGGQPILTDANVEEVVNAAFVVGQIMMWFGNVNNIPQGWRLCNGANGTPDLRNRFVVGAGDTYALSATGGATQSAASNTGEAGVHSHTMASVGDTTLTEAQLPQITLSVRGSYNAGGYDGGGNQFWRARSTDGYVASEGLIQSFGGGQAHTHSGGATTENGAHTHTTPAVATLPPYYGLYFIMFVGI